MMNLIKRLKTSSLLIEIYSSDPNFIFNEDLNIFEDKSDYEIIEIAFGLGVEQVNILDSPSGDFLSNFRSYSNLAILFAIQSIYAIISM